MSHDVCASDTMMGHTHQKEEINIVTWRRKHNKYKIHFYCTTVYNIVSYTINYEYECRWQQGYCVPTCIITRTRRYGAVWYVCKENGRLGAYRQVLLVVSSIDYSKILVVWLLYNQRNTDVLRVFMPLRTLSDMVVLVCPFSRVSIL